MGKVFDCTHMFRGKSEDDEKRKYSDKEIKLIKDVADMLFNKNHFFYAAKFYSEIDDKEKEKESIIKDAEKMANEKRFDLAAYSYFILGDSEKVLEYAKLVSNLKDVDARFLQLTYDCSYEARKYEAMKEYKNYIDNSWEIK